jgi:hypothetical protein
MARLVALLVLLCIAAVESCAQTTPTPRGESSSRAQPEQPPTPPDAPTPDLGTQTSPPPPSKGKKIADKFDPHCINVIFHVCWSSPAAPQGKVLTEEQKKAQQATEDIEVGYFYLNKNSFLAAESRLREAVDLKPDAAAAWVGLAQAQQKLGKSADARSSYEAYLKLEPEGHDADKVKKVLAELK